VFKVIIIFYCLLGLFFDLNFLIKLMMEIKLGKYRHYDGGEYEVLGMVIHSETQEEMVLYKMLYESPGYPYGTLWVRPAKMWNEMVEWNGEEKVRFELMK